MSFKSKLGSRLRRLRKARELTLVELAQLSNVSASTISKIENAGLSPTLDVIMRLAQGLGTTLSDLIDEEPGEGRQTPPPNGRFSPALKSSGDLLDTPNYDYLYLCGDLKNKRMVPILARIKAQSITEFGELVQHGGEEFMFVLEGEIEVHSDFYEPITLRKGEGVYLDSTMAHAYVNSGPKDAEVLCICTEPHLPG